VAGSLNVVSNRFKESPKSVLLSALTAGVINVTGQNISTFCIVALGVLNSNNNNLALVQLVPGASELCAELQKVFRA
jgi:p-aminobenzoyl-glutamate transporter AbgT